MRSLAIAVVLCLPVAIPRAASGAEPTTVIARLVDGPKSFIACGKMSFVGVYVYDVEATVSGAKLTGRIVVDVLCPDFYADHVKLTPGERHRLLLGPARSSYAGTTPQASPLPSAPRFQATKVLPP